MRRVAWILVGAFALSAVVAAEAEDAPKKVKKKAKKHKHVTAAAPVVDAPVTTGASGGPFSDVPQGHWAYEAIKKAVDAGILQGWENKFHGGKVVNRYQMAVVVARMLDRVGVMKAGNRVITAQDVANLESLTIEFADELALLNVKVNKIEDELAGLRKDIDWVKGEWASGGAKGGITGLAEIRGVVTGSGNNSWAPGPATGVASQVPLAGSTGPIVRYRGTPVAGAGTLASPFQYDTKDFVTVSNFALNIDRWFDPHVHFHSQIDFNAEGSRDAVGAAGAAGTSPSTGRGESFIAGAGGSDILIDEAYVTWDDWWGSGLNARAGVFALPMNFEVNGPSRTYQWTITPSIANSKWESIRPIGMDVFKLNAEHELQFYVGFFTPGDTSEGQFRSGTLLSAPTGLTGVAVPFGQAFAAGTGVAVQTDGGINPGGAVFGAGRFPTPLQGAAMTDAPHGVNGQTLDSSNIGFYAMIGSHPTGPSHEGLTWHVAYYDRNGNLRPALDSAVTGTDWYAYQGALSYQLKKFIFGGQYFHSTSRNYNLGDFAVDPRRVNTTPFINALGSDTESRSIMAFFNWQFCPKGSATFRYEYAEDATGPAQLNCDVYTVALNWRTSDHGWLQAEYINSQSHGVSENGVANDVDPADNLTQVNYKLNF